MYARTPKIETKRGLSSCPHWRVGMKAPWCEHSMDAMLEENKKEDRVKNATMVRKRKCPEDYYNNQWYRFIHSCANCLKYKGDETKIAMRVVMGIAILQYI
ncbi:hypothetical protein NDU88_002507 [Pleurodeles waltl]|uniref:Uncharacterized protein n=1 Tax=Pleurodeles waltl TaxID=8319 RepID=A0AAV7W2K7_PLEWA|nr:hypothetical protein NDU88_002507 [Pleurodeles waltl]